MTVYTGNQFPANMQDTLFVALWNGTDWAQRIIWIDPDDPRLQSEEYQLQAICNRVNSSDQMSSWTVMAHYWLPILSMGMSGVVSYTGGGAFTFPDPTATSGWIYAFPTNTPQS